MKTLSAKTRLVSLLGLFVFLWSTAYSQITPLGDSYINTADPTTNYGAKTLLDVDGASQTTYIQFNLGSIPANASVSQATLKLYVNSVTKAGSFNVDYVNAAWSESTIDSSNEPPLGAAIASNVSVTTADKNQYILINVTSAVQAWLSGSETNNGIALVANSLFNATFDSKENTTTSHPPELDIAFAGGDGTITGVETGSNSGLAGGGKSGTLNLSLLTSCASNQVLQWSGSEWKCSSAGTGTITGVTAGTDLTGGGSGGDVTLNLNTASVPQLNSANAFGALNTFPNVGIGTSSPLANLDVAGGQGLHILVGDPGCGEFAAIGFLTTPLSGCANYALLGDASGGTYINASGSSKTIHFRINNTDEAMDILSNGGVQTNGALGVNIVPGTNSGVKFELAVQPADNWEPFVAYGTGPGACLIDASGNLTCTGTKNAAVPVDAGSRWVAMSAIESAVNWFEDAGEAELANGSAFVTLDPTYIQTVNTNEKYQVFLTPYGDCKGLYVTNRTANSFEVHELDGGAASLTFGYRIMAIRKNYETVRFADRTREMDAVKRNREGTKSMRTKPQPSDPSKRTQVVPKPS
jgi:hypothetical protein